MPAMETLCLILPGCRLLPRETLTKYFRFSRFRLEGLWWPAPQEKKCSLRMVVASFFDACVSLYVCFYILSTHFKSLVCVVDVSFAVQKSPYLTLAVAPNTGLCLTRESGGSRPSTGPLLCVSIVDFLVVVFFSFVCDAARGMKGAGGKPAQL